MSQRADLSWRRCSSCSGEVSCQLKVNAHPCVGRDPCLIDKTFGQGQRVCVGVCVQGGVAVGGAEVPMSNCPSWFCFFSIQAGRGWVVVVSMLLLSLTITDTICYSLSPWEQLTWKIIWFQTSTHKILQVYSTTYFVLGKVSLFFNQSLILIAVALLYSVEIQETLYEDKRGVPP